MVNLSAPELLHALTADWMPKKYLSVYRALCPEVVSAATIGRASYLQCLLSRQDEGKPLRFENNDFVVDSWLGWPWGRRRVRHGSLSHVMRARKSHARGVANMTTMREIHAESAISCYRTMQIALWEGSHCSGGRSLCGREVVDRLQDTGCLPSFGVEWGKSLGVCDWS